MGECQVMEELMELFLPVPPLFEETVAGIKVARTLGSSCKEWKLSECLHVPDDRCAQKHQCLFVVDVGRLASPPSVASLNVKGLVQHV